MPKTNPAYAEAFKQQIVELHVAGRMPAKLSREFGVNAQNTTAWVVRAAADAGRSTRGKDVLTTADGDKLARLRQRVHQLERERDVLAKATATISASVSTPS